MTEAGPKQKLPLYSNSPCKDGKNSYFLHHALDRKVALHFPIAPIYLSIKKVEYRRI